MMLYSVSYCYCGICGYAWPAFLFVVVVVSCVRLEIVLCMNG